MSPGNDEPKEGDIESQNERLQGMGINIETGQAVLNIKHLKKSFEILKSALKIFTSNTKFMFLMVLSILPFFVFVVYFEIKLQKSIIYAVSNSLLPKSETLQVISVDLDDYPVNNTASNFSISSQPLVYDNFTSNYYYDDYSLINERREFLSDTLQLSLFYLFIYPILEFLSMSLTLKTAAEVHAASKQTTLRELLYRKDNYKGPFITYIYVHLMSTLTLSGLLWIVSNHLLVLSRFDYFESLDIMLSVLSVTVHSVIFLGLLYKYIEWSAFWNMSMVISVMEEQTGIEAFGMSDYYGKHCKKTGFQLMLGFFVFGNVLRLPCLFAGLCDGSDTGILITSIVIMMVSLGNMVKWVTFLLYFYHCKQQTMEKKVDDQEQDKTVKSEVKLRS